MTKKWSLRVHKITQKDEMVQMACGMTLNSIEVDSLQIRARASQALEVALDMTYSVRVV